MPWEAFAGDVLTAVRLDGQFRQRRNHVVDVGGSRRRHHLLQARPRTGVSQVLQDHPVKEIRFLGHDADVRAEVSPVEGPDVVAVESDDPPLSDRATSAVTTREYSCRAPEGPTMATQYPGSM